MAFPYAVMCEDLVLDPVTPTKRYEIRTGRWRHCCDSMFTCCSHGSTDISSCRRAGVHVSIVDSLRYADQILRSRVPSPVPAHGDLSMDQAGHRLL